MTRDRIHDMLDLVLECNEKFQAGMVDVGFEISCYEEEIKIWQKNADEEGITYHIYSAGVSHAYTKDKIKCVKDPDFVMAEAHVRRLLDETLHR